MACAAYPQNESFLAILRHEAEWVVRELRHHPCIALWAGDNECDAGYVGWWGGNTNPAVNRITREILPRVIQRLDPSRPYLPSSPYVSPPMFELGGQQGLGPEQHLWGPRGYYKSDFYAHNNACFASEMGYHGCPNVGSIKKFISADKLWPCTDNPEWLLHSTNPMPGISAITYRVELMRKQVREVFGSVPNDLETFALASQIVQAEAKKFFLELFRQRKWQTSGLLWWNMMDGWPQFSDAIVDYYFTRKLAFPYLKRVHKPLCVIVCEPENGKTEVMVSNDSLRKRVGHVRVWEADSAETLLETDFQVAANVNAPLGCISVTAGQQRLFLVAWESDGERGANHYLLGKPPFELARYQAWLPQIAKLDGSFDPAAVAQ